VSPHRRTLDTAAPVAAALPAVPVTVNTAIFEAGGIYDASDDYGSFVGRGGLSRSAMAAGYPRYGLPAAVTDAGWYAGAGRESDDECRERARGVLADLRTEASALEANKNVMMVVHYDFICALLDAVLAPETRGAFARWRHHNTAITVIDVTAKDGEVIFVAQNAVSHVTDPALLSGFPL